MTIREITCQERDRLLHREGLYAGWTVTSSFTDLRGEFGKPRVETSWESESAGLMVTDVRHPPGDGSYRDAKPCEHYATEPWED